MQDGLYAKLVAKQAERAADVLPEEGGASPPPDVDVDKLFDGASPLDLQGFHRGGAPPMK